MLFMFLFHDCALKSKHLATQENNSAANGRPFLIVSDLKLEPSRVLFSGLFFLRQTHSTDRSYLHLGNYNRQMLY